MFQMDPVVVQAAVLGVVGLWSVSRILLDGAPLAKYGLAWVAFHSSEYYFTRHYSRRTVTPYSFLIYGARGSVQLLAVHCLAICEYFCTQHYWHYHGFPSTGLAVAAAGISVRARAIYDCGDSFSHYIETDTPRVLVTSGVYGWCRHPSYAGFLLYVVGVQLVLGTVFVHAMSLAVLVHFFTKRIAIEEHFLVSRLYGHRYVQYRQSVRALVPCVY